MGTYSEMDVDKRYDGDPFEEDAFEEGGNLTPSAEAPSEKPDIPPREPPAPTQEGKAQENTEAAAVKKDEAAAEDAKRKTHEEAEAKRKAEWEAKQEEKKAALQEKINRVAAMSDDEVMTASMKRVSTDTEKLTRRNMKECVAEYIQTMCIEDPAFARKVMHPRKSMIRCFQYISRKAWDYVQDELKANGIQPGPREQGYGCDVPDDLCYQWSEDYFNDPDAEEDKVEEEKFVPKPYLGKTSKPAGKAKKASQKAEAKKAESRKPPQKPADDSGQISFGGFAMLEEKAG